MCNAADACFDPHDTWRTLRVVFLLWRLFTENYNEIQRKAAGIHLGEEKRRHNLTNLLIPVNPHSAESGTEAQAHSTSISRLYNDKCLKMNLIFQWIQATTQFNLLFSFPAATRAHESLNEGLTEMKKDLNSVQCDRAEAQISMRFTVYADSLSLMGRETQSLTFTHQM